ncbi:MAG: GNAT family N-acetyltransferase [Candidatus Paceibacteria bacterium]
MGQTTSFETKQLEECVELTKMMYRCCFPEEMWLSDEELHSLTRYNAEATVLTIDDQTVGLGITLPEKFAIFLLEMDDAEFQAFPQGVYSYTEAIIPSHQKRGYGALLLQEVKLRMKQRGFISISAHVRTRNKWNDKRRKTLNIPNGRFIHDFWPNERETVEFQRCQL